jgi:RNA polymerase sigma-70 factor (ECF subfamily)
LFKKKENIEDIIAGCRKKQSKSQEALYKEYFGYAMSVALPYAHVPDEAHEIVNDSFMKVFDKIDSYKESHSFKSWFRAIVVNTAIDYYRKNGKYRLNTDVEQADRSEYSEEILDSLNLENILELLNGLSDNQRVIFNLYEIEGYSHREIAEMLDITETASRTNLTRAKKSLRVLYFNYFEQHEETDRYSIEQQDKANS